VKAEDLARVVRELRKDYTRDVPLSEWIGGPFFGAWQARYLQAGGTLAKDDADAIVKQGRQRRRAEAARQRAMRHGKA
jgi:hypothetical protein